MSGANLGVEDMSLCNRMFKEGYGVDDIQIETGLHFSQIEGYARMWGFVGHAAVARNRMAKKYEVAE